MAFDGSIETLVNNPLSPMWCPGDTPNGGPSDMAPEDWEFDYGPNAMHRRDQPEEYRKVIEQVATGWEKFMNMLGLGRKDTKSKK